MPATSLNPTIVDASNAARSEAARLRREIDELKATLAHEKARADRAATAGIHYGVSPKGALSVYGLQRFPVTLYREQWAKLLGHAEDIRAFIAANDDRLVNKGESPADLAAHRNDA